MIKGHATAQAAAAYAQRFPALVEHFRPMLGIPASSIGLGTYLGNHDDRDDEAYAQALEAALLGGINVIDTAINYRFQRSERVIGKVLARLVDNSSIARAQVLIATKGGFVPFERDPFGEMEARFIRARLIAPDDLVESCHCIAPAFLDAMIEASRQNLGLETIDVYYLHNPEMQLAAIERPEFICRMRSAFELLEGKVADGRIGVYGTATWNAYRVAPQSPDYLSLEEMVRLAREVGGSSHHFKVIQLPYNLAMAEALQFANQPVGGRALAVLQAARELEVKVCVSATVLQGRLTQGLPVGLRAAFPGMKSDAQRAIQFVRSTPGVNVALVGMKSAAHVRENLETAARSPMSPQEFAALVSA